MELWIQHNWDGPYVEVFCLSKLERSYVVWGSSITQQNKDDLEWTQKYFEKLVLQEKYIVYESSLVKLDL